MIARAKLQVMVHRVAFLLSSAHQLVLADGLPIPAGVWAEELLLPYQVLTGAGLRVFFITPDNGCPQIDPQSLLLANLAHDRARLTGLQTALQHWRFEPRISVENVLSHWEPIAGLFIPGGNGPLMDLATPLIGQLLWRCQQDRIPVATLCHGATALLSPPPEGGVRAFAGFQVTCFSAAEEAQTDLAGRWPFTLEERLRAAGFQTQVGRPWTDHWVANPGLLCGQNPASAVSLSERFLQVMNFTT